MYGEEDFVEIVKRTSKSVSAPVVVRTSLMRGNLQRLSVSMAKHIIERVDGWPRFSVAWNAKLGVLRLRGARHGSHVAHKTPMGGQYLLRVEMPPEVAFVAGAAEAADYDVESGTLFIQVPQLYLRSAPEAPADTPTTPHNQVPQAVSRPKTHAEIVEAAKRAVPAPKVK